jgi:hypothetical protein
METVALKEGVLIAFKGIFDHLNTQDIEDIPKHNNLTHRTDQRDKYDEYIRLYERFKKYIGYLNTDQDTINIHRSW